MWKRLHSSLGLSCIVGSLRPTAFTTSSHRELDCFTQKLHSNYNNLTYCVSNKFRMQMMCGKSERHYSSAMKQERPVKCAITSAFFWAFLAFLRIWYHPLSISCLYIFGHAAHPGEAVRQMKNYLDVFFFNVLFYISHLSGAHHFYAIVYFLTIMLLNCFSMGKLFWGSSLPNCSTTNFIMFTNRGKTNDIANDRCGALIVNCIKNKCL